MVGRDGLAACLGRLAREDVCCVGAVVGPGHAHVSPEVIAPPRLDRQDI